MGSWSLLAVLIGVAVAYVQGPLNGCNPENLAAHALHGVTSDGSTALIQAAQCNSTSAVEAVLRHKPRVNVRNKKGWTALMHSAKFGNKPMLQAILNARADVNVQNEENLSALMLAASFVAPAYDCHEVEGRPFSRPHAKQSWCCAHYHLGCSSRARVNGHWQVIHVRYDCHLGLSNWYHGWSHAKKTWCCARQHLGCPGTWRGSPHNIGTEAVPAHDRSHADRVDMSSDIVSMILGHKADINHGDQFGFTALMLAAQFNQSTDMVQVMLDGKADVNRNNTFGSTALTIAAQFGSTGMVRALLGHKAEVNHHTRFGGTAVQIAAYYGSPEMARLLLKHKADVNARNESGTTALMIAASSKHSIGMVQVMLDHKADVNRNDTFGSSALTLAAQFGSTGMVRALLGHKAEVNHRTRTGVTAVMFAADTGSPEMLRLLLRHNADVNARNENGTTALMSAVTRHGSTQMVKDLLDHKAHVDAEDVKGYTPLMLATAYGSDETINVMLDCHPDVNKHSSDGYTALMLAASNRSFAIVERILQHGALPNAVRPFDGLTALHWAAATGNQQAIASLLKHRADANAQNAAGQTPLMVAVWRGHLRTADYLVDHGAVLELRSNTGQTALQMSQQRLFKTEKQVQEDIGKIKRSTLYTSPVQKQLLYHVQSEAWAARFTGGLASKTDRGFAVFCSQLNSSFLWLCLALGFVCGVIGGATVAYLQASATTYSADTTYCPLESDELRLGSRRIALKALVPLKVRLRCQMWRAMEAISCLFLPLGYAMLWINWQVVFVFFMLLYILPTACALRRRWAEAYRHPILLLVDSYSFKEFSAARIFRMLGTSVLLYVTWALPKECDYEVKYRVYGYMGVTDNLNGTLANVMVHDYGWPSWVGVPLLSRASAELVCPASNSMTSGRDYYFLYLSAIWFVSALWLCLSLVFAVLGCCCGGKGFSILPFNEKVAELASREKVAELASRIQKTSEAYEIHKLSTDQAIVEPEKAESVPSGIFFRLLLAFVDAFVMDFLSIYNYVRGLQFKFAGILVGITSASFVLECAAGHVFELKDAINESRKRGIVTKNLQIFLELEQSFEAPLAMCFTVYAWSFSVQDDLSLWQGLVALAISLYSFSDYVTWLVDLRLHGEEDAQYAKVATLVRCG